MDQAPETRMYLRLIVREIRDFPATFLFSASWFAVFVAMVVVHLGDSPPPTLQGLFLTGMGDGRRFGDLTLQGLADGEYWRLITCNFVHYSVIHIGMNLFAFYMLGCLLESWYGSWALVAIYGTTGVGGNLLSAVARRAIGASPLAHSGGGSVVIMGLIGLCATAGWVSRSSRDRELTWQMIKALAITGALGLAFPRFIDNWGHAGGAIAGLPIGLAHRRLLGSPGLPRALGAGVAWLLILVAGGYAQVRSDRRDVEARALSTQRRELDESLATYRIVEMCRQWAFRGGDARGMANMLRSQAGRLDRGPMRDPYRRLVALATQFERAKPTAPQIAAFRKDLELIWNDAKARAGGTLRAYWGERRSENLPQSSIAELRPAPR